MRGSLGTSKLNKSKESHAELGPTILNIHRHCASCFIDITSFITTEIGGGVVGQSVDSEASLPGCVTLSGSLKLSVPVSSCVQWREVPSFHKTLDKVL